ncbi:MAG: MFS transporter [Acidobacteriota bacterium]|nr:MFS transporter [Acidobacteriota bacterium]MDE3139612.1 MFS transporter [Acidobacteriota bacterium]
MPRLLVDWSPLRENRNFRLLVLGQLFSLLGSNVTMVAVPYQVYRQTHSSLWVGLASLVQLPLLIAGSLWGGAYGDRFDRRRLLIIGSLLAALTSAALAINAALSRHDLAVVLVLAALAAGTAGFSGPIRQAAMPTMLREDQLVSAYSLYQIVVNISVVAGPSLAGVLLASVSLSSCYLVDALTFAVLAVATMLMSALAAPTSDTAAALFAAIRDGFRYVRRHAVAQAVYLADLNANVFGLPRALFPAMAFTVYHGGPRTLGLLYAAPGIGALVLATLAGWINHLRRRGVAVLAVITIWGVAMTAFGIVHVLWFGVVVLAVAGAMDMVSAVLRSTILQLAIADEFRSRISSIQMAVVNGGPRLGDTESGVVASLSSTEFSIVSGGVACIVGVALLAWRRPTFWRQGA